MQYHPCNFFHRKTERPIEEILLDPLRLPKAILPIMLFLIMYQAVSNIGTLNSRNCFNDQTPISCK